MLQAFKEWLVAETGSRIANLNVEDLVSKITPLVTSARQSLFLPWQEIVNED